jgi:hypothetical protein
LTAEKFIPHPFAAEPGERLYRTGDLARYNQDGSLEFLGRVDHQVKVRGFRIELGEVEAALGSHPRVGECVAVVREDESGDKRIVAYMVMREGEGEGEGVEIGELRSHVRERLPEYMVPSRFVKVEEMARTPNGKVDRGAMAEADGGGGERQVGEAYVEPRNEVERQVARMWGEVLGVEQVGVYDNFFELGGHSLLATQVISRVRDTFHVEVPLRCMFETPTVAGLAVATIEKQIEQSGEKDALDVLQELESLSADEVRAKLAEEI